MRPGLRPGPHWRRLQSSQTHITGFQGADSRDGRGEKGMVREGRRKREG